MNAGLAEPLLPTGTLIVPEHDEVGSDPLYRPQEIVRHSDERIVDWAKRGHQTLSLAVRMEGRFVLDTLNAFVTSDHDTEANAVAPLPSRESQAAPARKLEQKQVP